MKIDFCSQGAIDCGLSTASRGIFQNGAFDLIDYFYKKSNKDLAAYLEKSVKEGTIKKKTS